MMMMMMNPQSTGNQSSAAATATAGLESFYLEDYLDCVENLPEDLQRNISHMRELDATYQEILRELESHQLNLQGTDETENGERTRKRILVHIQRSLIQLQEIFDEKLEIAQQILDMIENKSRQLDVDYRNIGMRAMNIGGSRENDNSEQSFSKADVQPERSSKRARRQRNEYLGQGAATFGTMTATAGMVVVAREDHSAGHHVHEQHLHQASDDTEEKDRTSSSMIAGASAGGVTAATAVSVAATATAMVGGVSAAASSSSSSAIAAAAAAAASVVPSHHVSAIATSSMAALSSSSATAVSATIAATAVASATVKKAKKKKRRSKAEMHVDRHQTSFSLHLRGNDSSLSSGAANMVSSLVVDDPLIDPDEPTYCLCQQISYGEMIGCDNDRCSIEWFHFSCVGLTTKPKGKWFCPRCRGDRPNVPRPGVRA